jgi:hypothetical protein
MEGWTRCLKKTFACTELSGARPLIYFLKALGVLSKYGKDPHTTLTSKFVHCDLAERGGMTMSFFFSSRQTKKIIVRKGIGGRKTSDRV